MGQHDEIVSLGSLEATVEVVATLRKALSCDNRNRKLRIRKATQLIISLILPHTQDSQL